jgi:SsrA-binding protein
MREGRVSLKDSYAEIRNGEVYLLHMNISPYEQANIFNHEPLREKKLLLHRQEIKRLIGKIREKGYTLIPTKVLFNEKGRVKVEVSLAKGKRTYEKKRAIKERDLEREVRAELKKRLR